MGGRLIDVEKLIDVLLEEREDCFRTYDNETQKSTRYEAVSECIGLVNQFPEYAAKDDLPTLMVSDFINRYFCTSSASVVLKRSDTGREYRRIKDALDDKNWWEVVGLYPRIKTNGNAHAQIEMVLWCRDHGSDTKDLYSKVKADYVIALFGSGESKKDGEK